MNEDTAMQILTAHKNGWACYDYDTRKEAMSAIKHLVTEWIQRVDTQWQLVVVGYY